MNAELLRKAAALMRERAEAATPGPWAWKPPSSESWPMADESLVALDDGWQPDSYFGGCSPFLREFHGTRETEDGGHLHRTTKQVVSGWGHDASGTDASDADRAHIASWHPAVALAVADWLEHVADLYDDPADRIVSEQTMWDAAITVARAYLGPGA